MGYLFLLISLLAGATKGFCGKKTSVYTAEYRHAVLVNVIRMLFCMIIGSIFVLFGGGIKTLVPTDGMLPFAALAGVSTSVFAVTWLLSVRVGAYMLVDIALMCSVLVPLLGSLVFLGEAITWQDAAGLGLLLAAVVCMYLYNNKTKAKLTAIGAVLLVVCGFASGLSDFSQKLYAANGTAIAAFSFYTYVFATLTLGIFYLCTATKKKHKASDPFPLGRVLPFIIVMALCMFAASFFQTLAAQRLSSAALFPLARGVALILSALMSRIFFGEKLTAGSLTGIALALVALVVMQL